MKPQLFTTKGTILVVDDTPQNLKLLSNLLTQEGYHVRCVISGSAALMTIQAELPDLILLDINMPVMNGYEVCQHLKENPLTQQIPIIFLSALDDLNDKVKAFKVGGVDYITKPFDFEEVVARVETHLTLLRLQQQLQEKNDQLELELSRAGKIQMDLLPSHPPRLELFEVAALCVPAAEVGGDFYDWIQLSSNRISFVLGDVMGKGMPAALLMATVRATLRATTDLGDPLTVIEHICKTLEPDLIRSESFVTLFYAHLQSEQRQLMYVDAGHSHCLFLRHQGPRATLVTTGPPFGGIRIKPYFQEQITFGPQDALVVYSDGLWDARPELNLNVDLLVKQIQGCESAQAILDRIVELLELECNKNKLIDDVTLLVVRCLR